MALILKDRVQELSTTVGTVSFALTGPTPSYQDFNSAIGVGNTCYYAAVHQDSSLDEWEVGVGTLTGAAVLARTTILSSSNSGSIVNFSTGAKLVFVTLPAERAVYEDAAGNAPFETDNEAVAITLILG
jgi:hypothetical protein